MARFDVYANGRHGYLLDVQTDLLEGFSTRLVVPLMPEAKVPKPILRLHPIVEIEGRRHVMATHLMAAVALADLGKPVENLDRHYERIVAAIDMVFLGF